MPRCHEYLPKVCVYVCMAGLMDVYAMDKRLQMENLELKITWSRASQVLGRCFLLALFVVLVAAVVVMMVT